MLSLAALQLTSTLLFAPSVGAGDSDLSAPPLLTVAAEEAPPAPPSPKLALLGVRVDAGVPSGLGASLVLRPWNWLRVEAGGIHNGFAPGLRGGVTVAPFRSWVTPTLSVEAGHYFEGNANTLVQRFQSSFSSPYLDRVQYDFQSAYLGVELGSQRRFSVSLQAGVSHVTFRDGSFASGLSQSTGGTWTSGPLALQGNSVSGKLGFTLFVG